MNVYVCYTFVSNTHSTYTELLLCMCQCMCLCIFGSSLQIITFGPLPQFKTASYMLVLRFAVVLLVRYLMALPGKCLKEKVGILGDEGFES